MKLQYFLKMNPPPLLLSLLLKGVLAGFADYMVHVALTKEEIGFFIIPFHRDTTGLQWTKMVLT